MVKSPVLKISLALGFLNCTYPALQSSSQQHQELLMKEPRALVESTGIAVYDIDYFGIDRLCLANRIKCLANETVNEDCRYDFNNKGSNYLVLLRRNSLTNTHIFNWFEVNPTEQTATVIIDDSGIVSGYYGTYTRIEFPINEDNVAKEVCREDNEIYFGVDVFYKSRVDIVLQQ